MEEMNLDSHEVTLLMDNNQAREALAIMGPLFTICMLCIIAGSVVFALMQQGALIVPNSMLADLTLAYTEYLRRLLQPISEEMREALSTDVLKALLTYLTQIDEINGRILDIALINNNFDTRIPLFVNLNDAIKDIDNTLASIFDGLDAGGFFDGAVLIIN